MLDPPRVPAPAAPPAASAAGNGSGATPAALDADGITVRFGGLIAVGDASLRVERGETVGLIGPNGAGKTTLFNAICGMNSPQAGRVTIKGNDATQMGVHQRAALGVGRTFQSIQLFKESTVFDNLMVATHLHGTTGPGSHLLLTDKALRDENAARDRVRAASATVGLDPVLDARCGDLPFGVLRMVEIARALVTGADLILLDEPASGLDERETDRLGALLVALREGLGLSLLIVEHDVRFVTSLSDRMYVLDQGRIIATGTPADIRRDPLVIAAYLGTGDDTAQQPAVASV